MVTGRLRGRRFLTWLRHRQWWIRNVDPIGESEPRITEDGEFRMTEDGEFRVTEGD